MTCHNPGGSFFARPLMTLPEVVGSLLRFKEKLNHFSVLDDGIFLLKSAAAGIASNEKTVPEDSEYDCINLIPWLESMHDYNHPMRGLLSPHGYLGGTNLYYVFAQRNLHGHHVNSGLKGMTITIRPAKQSAPESEFDGGKRVYRQAVTLKNYSRCRLQAFT